MKSYQLGKDIQKMVDRLDTIEDQLQLLLSTRSVGSNDQNDTRSMPIRNEPPPLHEYGYLLTDSGSRSKLLAVFPPAHRRGFAVSNRQQNV